MAKGPMLEERRSFVAGTWVDGDTAIPVENPADESIITEVVATPLAEVERAIAEARRTFDAGVWADLPRTERVAAMTRFLDHLEANRQPFAETIMAEAGQPRVFADATQVVTSIATGRATIELYQSMADEEFNPVPVDELVRGRVALSIRRHEPMGVVAAITPYNGAIIMALQKMVPALLTGNSVILRPSPLTPWSSLLLGSAAEAAGIPKGVVSVVIEAGNEGAELLTTDPRVDMVSFTGSTQVGRMILAQAAATIKNVALELGGKSAQIYLPDAIDKVGMGAMMVCAMTSGQACVAATRMVVPQESKEQVIEMVTGTYGMLSVGDPTDPCTTMGPVINDAARARCERIVDEATQAGATIAFGGNRPSGFEKGYYFEPTVLDVPDNSNPAAQQEIFGPVISIIGYGDLDEAVAIANDSPYGLSAQVYGADVAAATTVARRIRSGAVNVNTSVFSAYAPSGGYKQSGLGRERGPEGIRSFQEIKHLAIGELR